jgi:hypothetical protein
MSSLQTIYLSNAILGCVAINFIGLRFLLSPTAAAEGYGVSLNDTRAFTAIKGVRDITSGIVPLVVLQVAGRQAFGYAMMAASITPIGDALIVLARGGKTAVALGIHGLTAALLLGVGYGLASA